MKRNTGRRRKTKFEKRSHSSASF